MNTTLNNSTRIQAENAAKMVEMLRRKLIRETECYLSNPEADCWAKLALQRGTTPVRFRGELTAA